MTLSNLTTSWRPNACFSDVVGKRAAGPPEAGSSLGRLPPSEENPKGVCFEDENIYPGIDDQVGVAPMLGPQDMVSENIDRKFADFCRGHQPKTDSL